MIQKLPEQQVKATNKQITHGISSKDTYKRNRRLERRNHIGSGMTNRKRKWRKLDASYFDQKKAVGEQSTQIIVRPISLRRLSLTRFVDS